MTTSRLESLSSDLAGKLRRASTAKQRAACLAACELAVAKAKFEHPLVDEALQKLHAGESFPAEMKAKIDALALQLDEEYFKLQEAADVGGGTFADYLRIFVKARAIAALSFAGNEDTAKEASDAIYEAAAAVGDDKRELFALIESILK